MIKSPDQLKRELGEQLTSLLLDCENYDRGQFFTAKSMATHLRILFHDSGGNSCSLLGQLTLAYPADGVKYERICSTRHEGKLRVIDVGGLPLRSTDRALVDRRDWWQCEQFSLGVMLPGGHFDTWTRQELTRTVADQEGGAHVDPQSSPQYVSTNSVVHSVTYTRDDPPPPNSETRVFAAMRTLASEVLETFS